MSIAPGRRKAQTRRGWLMLLMFLAGTIIESHAVNRSGQILGEVKDSNGRGIADAEVLLFLDGQPGSLKRTTTDASGRYILAGVAYGAYQVTVTSKGFEEAGPKLVILASEAETVDFDLVSLSGKSAVSHAAQKAKLGSRQPPSFGAAGVEGTIAPTGYSTGLTSEETSVVMHDVDSLDREVLRGIIPLRIKTNCDREPELLGAAEAEPNAFGPNFELGVFYLDHGEPNRSIKFLKMANEVSPADQSAARELALAFLGAKRYADAVALLERISQNSDATPPLLRLLAIAYDEVGERKKALAAYQRSARLDSSVENQFACGMGLIGIGASVEAAKLFADATSSHPDSARLLADPFKWTEPRMIFVNSMSDLFHSEVPDSFITRVTETMRIASWHTYQVLTKRSERMRDLLCGPLAEDAALKHVWWGVSVENRRHGFPRIADLQATPAAVRFLSVEPLLEDLGKMPLEGISWVIVGGGERPRRATDETRMGAVDSGTVPASTSPFLLQAMGRREEKTGRKNSTGPYLR